MDPDLEQLLARSNWVRRLARGMVVGADEADDLAQDTWAAVLERPPAPALPFKAWFAGVMRNLARQRRRSAARRLEHEHGAVRSGRGEDEDLIERLELHRRMVEAVHSLEDPYRRVLLLRYFEDLPPAKIAERTGTPLRTVHTQLHRGLARLRERLGPHSREELIALVMPLPSLSLVTAPTAAAAVGALAMNLKLKLALVAVAIVGTCAYFFVPWRGLELSGAPNEVAHGAEIEAVTTPEPTLAAPLISESAEPARTLAAESGSVPNPTPAAKGIGLGEVRGRFLLPNGSPAFGAKLSLHGWCGNDERSQKFGLPDNWVDPETITDADGRLSLSFDPPRAFTFILRLQHPGSARLSWQWYEFPPGKIADLGEITLQPAGSIRGRVVDSAGVPLLMKWRIEAMAAYTPPGEGAQRTRLLISADPATSEFVLDDLPPGAVQLKAQSTLVNWYVGPVVSVEAGKQTTADIVYGGPDIRRRIMVTTRLPRSFPFGDVEAGALLLTGPGHARTPAQQLPNWYATWCFDNLEPGSYTLQMEDPRFEPWSLAGIQPGESVKVPLVGNAAFQLAVRDAASGEPIENYTLRLQYNKFLNALSSPATLRDAGKPAPPAGLYDGLVSGEVSITVGAEGYSDRSVDLGTLAKGERRSVTVDLDQGSRVAGIVSCGGQPRPGVTVGLRTYVEMPADLRGPSHSETFNRMRAAFRAQRETSTDAAGRFVFERIPPGRYEACTNDGPRLLARTGVIECPGENESLQLALPPSGWLVGSVSAPDGADFAGMGLALENPQEQEVDQAESLRLMVESVSIRESEPLDANGRVRIGPLPLGEYRVHLATGTVMTAQGFNAMSGSGGERMDLGVIAIVAGENPHQFDLQGRCPGRIRIQLFVDGKPASGVECMAVREVRDPFEFSDWDAAAPCGPDGIADVGPLFPGPANLYAGMIDGSWIWRAPQNVVLPEAGKLSLRFDIALHPGVLHIDDAATGKPMANQVLSIDTGGSAIHPKTDEHGDVHLRLPDCRYFVSAREERDRDDLGIGIDWGPDGPTPAVLRLAAH